MKTKAIVEGGIYHDGKLGVRKVTRLDVIRNDLTYEILSARDQVSNLYAKGVPHSLIGQTSRCEVTSFAAWAKVVVAPDELSGLMTDLRASRLKLSPGEKNFLLHCALMSDWPKDVAAGTSVLMSEKDSRAVNSLTEKGLLLKSESEAVFGHSFALTQLGAAWVRKQVVAGELEKTFGKPVVFKPRMR